MKITIKMRLKRIVCEHELSRFKTVGKIEYHECVICGKRWACKCLNR